jgi:hypothetical protein
LRVQLCPRLVDFPEWFRTAAIFIWHLTGQGPHKVEDIGIGYPLVLTSLASLGTQASVITAMPVDDQLEVVGHDIDDDLSDHQTNDLLARFNACAGTAPGPREITAECEQAFAILNTERVGRACVVLSELLLERMDAGQSLVPTPF